MFQAADFQFHGEKNTVVDVRYNNISEIDLFEVDKNYKYSFNYENANVPVKYFYIEGNPINCSCYDYSFLQCIGDRIISNIILLKESNFGNLQCGGLEAYTGNIKENISINNFACLFKKQNLFSCPIECNCLFRTSDTALIVDCYKKNITSMPEALPVLKFSKYTELNLSGNRIVSVKSPLGRGYNKVTNLTLSNNIITEIDYSAFSLHLQVSSVRYL